MDLGTKPSIDLNVRKRSETTTGNDTHIMDDGSSGGGSSCSSVYLEEYSPSTQLLCPREVAFDESETSFDSSYVSSEDRIRWKRQVDYWQRIAMQRSVVLGPRHIRTAECLMNLGNAQLSCQEYGEAGKSYLAAVKIYRVVHRKSHLSVARALDKVGLAASMALSDLNGALAALNEALSIRCNLLGPGHIDSVDTLNHLAGVRLNRGEYETAADMYLIVFRYREQIFGRCHASVAVVAYTLGCILSDHLDKPKKGQNFLRLSQSVYEELGLHNSYLTDIQSRLGLSLAVEF